MPPLKGETGKKQAQLVQASTQCSDNEWEKEPPVPKATQQQLMRQTQRTTNDYCCEEQ